VAKRGQERERRVARKGRRWINPHDHSPSVLCRLAGVGGEAARAGWPQVSQAAASVLDDLDRRPFLRSSGSTHKSALPAATQRLHGR
jgi:hypothetical protein